MTARGLVKVGGPIHRTSMVTVSPPPIAYLDVRRRRSVTAPLKPAHQSSLRAHRIVLRPLTRLRDAIRQHCADV